MRGVVRWNVIKSDNSQTLLYYESDAGADLKLNCQLEWSYVYGIYVCPFCIYACETTVLHSGL